MRRDRRLLVLSAIGVALLILAAALTGRGGRHDDAGAGPATSTPSSSTSTSVSDSSTTTAQSSRSSNYSTVPEADPASNPESGPESVPAVLPARMRLSEALGLIDLTTIREANPSLSDATIDRVLDDDSTWVDERGFIYFVHSDGPPDPNGFLQGEEGWNRFVPAEPQTGDPQNGPEPSSWGADLAPQAVSPTVVAVADALNLDSRPKSKHVIFLDFDGATVTNTAWNSGGADPIVAPPFDRDGNPSTFSEYERAFIIGVWSKVAEDYAPFDVNVTTHDPGFDAIDRSGPLDDTFGTTVVITSAALAPSICGYCGGVAYLGAFDRTGYHGYLQPAWTFVDWFSTSSSVAGTVSHEVGHNFGLNHDGTATSEYYGGQGIWEPIMGGGPHLFNQFSIGDYAGANNHEDDLALIASHGAPFVADDFPDSIGSAPLVAIDTTPVAGLITDRNDVDVLGFTTSSRTMTFSASPDSILSNLDLKLELLDSNSAVIASADPSPGEGSQIMTGMGATITRALSPGTYYLRVSGVGYGDPLATGYSDYGSVGRYTVRATSPTLTVTRQGSGAVTSSVGGINCGSTCSASIAAGTTVRLTATPATGFGIAYWVGACESAYSAASICDVVIDQSRTVYAVFRPLKTLTVLSNGPGRIDSSDGSISCGTSVLFGQRCTVTTARPDITLIARPDTNGVLSSWTGACTGRAPSCQLFLTSTTTTKATFVAGVPITVTPSPVGVISVESAGGTRWCDGTGATNCSAVFLAGESLTLTAYPTDRAHVFGSWSGACSGSANVCTIRVSTTASTTASFGVVALVPVTPQRIFDTRPGAPPALRPVPAMKIARGGTLRVKFTDLPMAGIPATGVAAVSLNVTATDPEDAGYVTVFPCGTMPLASNVNYYAGDSIPNAVLAPVSPSGEVCFFSLVATHLVVDVNGWIPTGSGLRSVNPQRLFDTRPDSSNAALRTVPRRQLNPEEELRIKVSDLLSVGIPASNVGAITLNVTVTDPLTDGFVSVYPCGDRPLVSNLNFTARQTIANAVITSVSSAGEVCFFSNVATHLLADIDGWSTSAAGVNRAGPARVLDTRPGLSFATLRPRSPSMLRSGTSVELVNLPSIGIPANGVRAVILNVTSTESTDAGYVAVTNCVGFPSTSSVNFRQGQTIANLVITPVSQSGFVCLFVNQSTHVVVDVAGWIS